MVIESASLIGSLTNHNAADHKRNHEEIVPEDKQFKERWRCNKMLICK